MKYRALIDDIKEFNFYAVVIFVIIILPTYGFREIWLTIISSIVVYILLLSIYAFVMLAVRHFRGSKIGGKGPEA